MGEISSAVTKRKSISKKLRFEIFKRDSFACQYCGKNPPSTILEIDHIVAVSNGGDNSIDNLITSCFDCNRGKGALPLNQAPMSLVLKTQKAKELEEQLEAYKKIKLEIESRIEDEAWDIVGILHPTKDSIRKDWFLSIKTFLTKLNYFDVLEAAQIAIAKKPWGYSGAFRYFCGICHNKIREANHG